MVVRGRPIARARSVVPVPVRPSATQRVPECVCVKLREYARVMLHRYEVQYIRACIICWTGYIGVVRRAVTAVVSQGSRIFPAISLVIESVREEQTSLESYKDVRINTFTKEC